MQEYLIIFQMLLNTEHVQWWSYTKTAISFADVLQFISLLLISILFLSELCICTTGITKKKKKANAKEHGLNRPDVFCLVSHETYIHFQWKKWMRIWIWLKNWRNMCTRAIQLYCPRDLHWLILLQSPRLWRVSCHLGKYMFFFWIGNQN